MPIYEYACADCEAEFEQLIMGAPRNNGDAKAVTCPSCDEPVLPHHIRSRPGPGLKREIALVGT